MQSQINELDDKVEKFRKRYFASKILGFVLPIVFVAVMLIILLASGALGNIFDYFGILSDYANM